MPQEWINRSPLADTALTTARESDVFNFDAYQITRKFHQLAGAFSRSVRTILTGARRNSTADRQGYDTGEWHTGIYN